MKSMRFIHTADLHLDSALTALDGAKAKIRRREITDTFVRMADYAITNEIDGIIVAGDLFDTKNATPSVKKQVADVIKKASAVKFFLLGGNHDGKAFDDDFIAMMPSNAVVLKNGSIYECENVRIVGYDIDNLDLATIPAFDENYFNVLVLHGEGFFGTGANSNAKKLAGKNINYLALGHIHFYSQGKIDKRGKYVYSGCPEGRGFDELGEKGFVIFDTDGNAEFKSFCTRQCREVKVDVSGLDSYVTQYDEVEKAIKDFSKADMYKIVLTGEREEGQKIETNKISQKLNENNVVFFAKVVDETVLKLDLNKLKKEVSLKGEFFRVVESLGLDERQKSDVLKFGFNAMDGLEVDDD